MDNEIENVIERYQKRKNEAIVLRNSGKFYFNHFAQAERELKYTEIIKNRFATLDSIKLIEIGAGTGGNIYFFQRLGFKSENLFANELLQERFFILNNLFPNINTFEGDACIIDESLNNQFDIVFQSTVFTSILDLDFKKKLADKMWALLKPNGIIIWYDFAFDNPRNKDVKGIKKNEIKLLFKKSKKINSYKTTLAPPIGRRVKTLYPFINVLPFLRTHIVAVIEK